MDCWRQWIRHRTANVNEYSTRYSLAIDAMQTTEPDAWRTQATQNRQGSGEPLSAAARAQAHGRRSRVSAASPRRCTKSASPPGVAREQARKDLPLSTYTEAYWKVDLHNLLHFLALRMDSHAQWEIREYATTIGHKIVQPLFPLVWEAFVDYRLEGLFLSRLDRELIARLMTRLAAAGRAQASEEDFLAVQDPTWNDLTRSRERDECREKLRVLNLLS